MYLLGKLEGEHIMTNLEKQILDAAGFNWFQIIKEKTNRLIKEHINDIDLSIKVFNGEIRDMAIAEFNKEKLEGMYDSQNMRIA